MPSVVDSLRATVPALIALVTGSKSKAFDRRPAPNEWNAATILGHLADAELVYAVRIRSAVAEPGSSLPAFDENKWADRFGPLDDDPNRSLARFRLLREATVAIVETLTDDEWARVGLHDELGEVTVRELVDRVIAHDTAHLDQLRTALGAS